MVISRLTVDTKVLLVKVTLRVVASRAIALHLPQTAIRVTELVLLLGRYC